MSGAVRTAGTAFERLAGSATAPSLGGWVLAVLDALVLAMVAREQRRPRPGRAVVRDPDQPAADRGRTRAA